MSNKPNPFEEMQNRQIRTFFDEGADRKIKAGLDSRMGTFRLLGSIADVYLNRLVDTMVGMANGAAETTEQEEQSEQSRLKSGDHPRTGNKYPNL
ncbi:MAG: hypothetical protein AAFP77_15105 [Bacteroidota bacterium]